MAREINFLKEYNGKLLSIIKLIRRSIGMFSYIYQLNIVMVHMINTLNYLYIIIYYLVCCKRKHYKNIYRTLNGMLIKIPATKLLWLIPYNCHNLVVSTNTNKGVNYEHNKKI